jgi:hypothetical protein
MPLIVRELVVRATVEPGNAATRPSATEAGSGPRGDDQRQLVAEAVDEVLRILRERKER